jgi:hypothetical protein
MQPASSPDWPGLTLSEGLHLDRLGGAGVRALRPDDLYELQALVAKALFEPPPPRVYRRGDGSQPRPLVERASLTLDQRIWLRGLREAAPVERSRRHQAHLARRAARVETVAPRPTRAVVARRVVTPRRLPLRRVRRVRRLASTLRRRARAPGRPASDDPEPLAEFAAAA